MRFRLTAQLAEPGDQTKDPTGPWPANRKVADLGTITLTKAASDNAAAQKALLLLPSNLTEGIEVSDDPLIEARDQAYAVCSAGARSNGRCRVYPGREGCGRGSAAPSRS